MSWPDIAERFGRDFVESVHDQVLVDFLRMWYSRQTPFGRALNDAGLSDEQRRVVWGLLASAVETTYHHFVDWVDQKVDCGELSVRLIDRQKPETSRDWRQAQIGMPYGFSSDMVQRYGMDPQKLYNSAAARPTPPTDAETNDLSDVKEFTDALEQRVISQGRCVECGRPAAALRRTCKACGQPY